MESWNKNDKISTLSHSETYLFLDNIRNFVLLECEVSSIGHTQYWYLDI